MGAGSSRTPETTTPGRMSNITAARKRSAATQLLPLAESMPKDRRVSDLQVVMKPKHAFLTKRQFSTEMDGLSQPGGEGASWQVADFRA